MTFVEADALTNALDQMYSITETGAYRRKKYTELGHLLINNLEQVRGS
jgi:sorbitol-specific phosphotransferase system component IIA